VFEGLSRVLLTLARALQARRICRARCRFCRFVGLRSALAPFLPAFFVRKRTAVSEVDGCLSKRRDALRACPGIFAVTVEHGA